MILENVVCDFRGMYQNVYKYATAFFFVFLMFDLFLLNRKFFHQSQDRHKKYFFRWDKKFYLQCKVWLMASYWKNVIFFSIFLALPKESQSLCCIKTFMFACVRMQTHIIHQCRSQTLRSLFSFDLGKDLIHDISWLFSIIRMFGRQ